MSLSMPGTDGGGFGHPPPPQFLNSAFDQSMNINSTNATTVISSSTSIKSIPLHFWMCYFLESNDDGIFPTQFPNLQFKCTSQGRYLTGREIGRIVSVIILVLIYIVGLFGFVTNVLNVIVLKRSLKGASVSMKRLLIVLAGFELCACLFSIIFSTILITIQENLDRSEVIFFNLKIFNALFGFARTSATYITILVAIERYLVVAFPIQSKPWLTPRKSQFYLCSVIVFTALLAIPWLVNSEVTKNTYIDLAPRSQIAEFPFVMNNTQFGKVVYPKIRHVLLAANFVAPFPLILIFNILLYRSIHIWNKSRQGLTRTQRKEINAAKMFSIVVLVLLSCHTVSCVIYFTSQYFMEIHRELLLLQNFATTLSAAINFLVYIGFGTAFKQEFRKLVRSKWALVRGQPVTETDVGGHSSREGESSIVMPERSSGGMVGGKRNGSTTSSTICC